MATSPSPHDEFFKEIFGDLDRARDFLRDTLPAEIRGLLDLDRIERQSESFLTEELAETYADLVFSCPLANSTALVALLLEHKSWAPRHPHLQLLSYMLGIWQHSEKSGKPLPVVLPIVLYQGREAWRVRQLVESIDACPEILRPFLPDFSFLLVDLARFSHEDLHSHYGNRSVLLAMELMKEIFSREEVARILERLTPEDGPLDRDRALRFLRVVLRYIFRRSDLGHQEALGLSLHPDTRRLTMTLEEQILKKGMEKGMEKGLEQGIRASKLEDARRMLERGCEWAFITDITGIKPEELAEG